MVQRGTMRNRTATKARAISRNRSIIGCPLTGNSLGRRAALAVGATSFGPRPVANRAHRENNLGRSAEVAVAAQLQGWMLAGIRGACQIISGHFWIDGGGRMRGRARDRLA